jgi:NAD(P)-dependent dehydrogenase (short-subunit alcohol dehydrogenase family)
LDKTYKMGDRLDIILSTVGIGSYGAIIEKSPAEFTREVNINLVPNFLAVRYGAPLMKNGGSIVCVSSTAAKLSVPLLAAYGVGKAALEHFVRIAADELGPKKIRINAVRPGLTRTPGIEVIFENKEWVRRFLDEIPLGRTGVPDDIGQAMRYLAGPESAWVTGQSFGIDGGQEVRRQPFSDDVFSPELAALDR